MTFPGNVLNFINAYSSISRLGNSAGFNSESNGGIVCFSLGEGSSLDNFFGLGDSNDCTGCNKVCNAESNSGSTGGFLGNLFKQISSMLEGIFGSGRSNSGCGGSSANKAPTNEFNGGGGSTNFKDNANGCGCPGGGSSGPQGPTSGGGSAGPNGGASSTQGLDNYINGSKGKGETYNVNGLGQNKQKIVAAAQKAGAGDKETAALLAIANQETQKMDCNYAYGDNKGGDSACFTPFKCNGSMIKEAAKDGVIDQKYASNPGAINNDLDSGVKVMTHLMKKYGMKKFIDYHRGGTSGRDGNYPRSKMDDYDKAMHNLISAYANDKSLWSSDERVKSNVKAI